MNAPYYGIIGQEMGFDNKAIASRNDISNFLLCFVFEMDATVRLLQKKKKIGTQTILGLSKFYCKARIVMT